MYTCEKSQDWFEMYAIKYENPVTGVRWKSKYVYFTWQEAYDQCEMSRKQKPHIKCTVLYSA